MRETFRGYYRPTKAQFDDLWDEAIFSFDTNALLNLYRYSKRSVDSFFTVLDELQDRIWIPYQVGVEFHRNRVGVIKEQSHNYDRAKSALDRLMSDVKQLIKNNHPFVEEVHEQIASLQERLAKHQDEEDDLYVEDWILERITSLFSGKIGSFSAWKECKEKAESEYEERYSRRIPPGFEDLKDKSGDKAIGDLIIWFELLETASRAGQSVILVCDDTKEDWWWTDKAGKTLGPHPLLRQEFHDETQADFYMYSTDQFIKYAQVRLGLPEMDSAVNEARQTRTSREYESEEFAPATEGGCLPLFPKKGELPNVYGLQDLAEHIEYTMAMDENGFGAPHSVVSELIDSVAWHLLQEQGLRDRHERFEELITISKAFHAGRDPVSFVLKRLFNLIAKPSASQVAKPSALREDSELYSLEPKMTSRDK